MLECIFVMPVRTLRRQASIPCRRILMAPHASGAVRILADPISTGQPLSAILIPAHTTQTRCCDASNRILSVASPVIATLILRWSAFSSCWPDLYGGPESIPCRRIFPASHASEAWKITASPHRTGQQSNQLIPLVPRLQSLFRSLAVNR